MKGFIHCGMLLLAFSTSSYAQDTPPLSDQEKLYGLSLFWKEAAYNFAYFDKQPNLNWDAEYQKFIPKVLASKSTFEYYRVMSQFSALLKDGHTDISYPNGLNVKAMVNPLIGLMEASRQAVVISVAKNLEDKIPLGSKIIAVDDKPLAIHLEQSIFPYISASSPHVLWSEGVRHALLGKPDSSIKILFEKPSGLRESLVIKRNSHKLWNSPISYLNLPSAKSKLFHYQPIPNNIAYVALNSFSDRKIVGEFNEAYPAIRKAKALIIDLRFNGGGDTDIGVEILSNFTNKDLLGAGMRTRHHVATYKAWGRLQLADGVATDYREFAEDNAWIKLDTSANKLLANKKDTMIVPTIILTSRYTESAAEDFLIYASQLPQVKTLGENTNGSTGQPIIFALPGGGYFRICTKRDTYPDGREFVGTGIIPNIPVQLTPEILRSGKDVVLDRAIEELEKFKL